MDWESRRDQKNSSFCVPTVYEGKYEEESDQTESQQEYTGQRTERDEIEGTAAIAEPVRFPFDRVERLAIDKQAVFIKPEGLLEMDQDLFGQAMARSLLQHETAKESAPDEIDQGEQKRLGQGEMYLDRRQQQREASFVHGVCTLPVCRVDTEP